MNVMTHTVALAGYATTVAVCAPPLLPTRHWVQRSPRLALSLWHTAAASVLLALGLTAVEVTTPMLLGLLLDSLLAGRGAKGSAVVDALGVDGTVVVLRTSAHIGA